MKKEIRTKIKTDELKKRQTVDSYVAGWILYEIQKKSTNDKQWISQGQEE